MATPEHPVKEKVKRVLRNHGVYFLMPVQQGIGAAGVDFHCVKGVQGFPLAFFVETKRYGGELTLRQKDFIAARKKQGARTFVVDCSLDVERLEQWLVTLERLGLMALIPDFMPDLQAYSATIK